jgi:hypothetical protein
MLRWLVTPIISGTAMPGSIAGAVLNVQIGLSRRLASLAQKPNLLPHQSHQ